LATTEPAQLRDPRVVGDAVASWAAERFGASVTVVLAENLSGGMDNYVHALQLEGDALPDEWRAALVVRIAPSADRLPYSRSEMEIQNWVVSLGFPAARVLALLHDDWALRMPAQVAVRAPGGQLLDSVKEHPRHLAALIGMLANLHADLHSLDPAGWPVPEARHTAASRRVKLIRERVEKGNAAMGDALQRVERGIAWCESNPVPATVCHGDFHPLNVVYDFDTKSAVVVDWTDATVDDPHSDISRTATLFRCAAIAGGSAAERVVLRIIGPVLAHLYLRAYSKRRTVDRARLRHWEALHLLNGLAQIDSLTDPDLESSAAGQSFPDWIVRSIRRRLEKTLRRAQRPMSAETPWSRPAV
jgi:aminoglycoside phosphotransferase (APT) family kinase protein